MTRLDGDALHPDWSPDGHRIVFALETEDSGSIELMSVNGGELVDLTPRSSWCAGQPSFTPDGQRIVFERFNPETNDDAIWSMKVDGSEQRRIIAPPTAYGWLAANCHRFVFIKRYAWGKRSMNSQRVTT